MTLSLFDKGGNVFNRPLETFTRLICFFFVYQDVPKSYLECFKRLNLIFAMDKPHCFEGRALDFFPNPDFCGFLKKITLVFIRVYA